MDFLNNPEEQSRIKIKKIADQPKPAAAIPGAKPGQPGLPGAKPGVPGAPGAKPGLPGAKPGVPGTPGAKPGTPVAAVVKPKQPPKVQVNQVEPGIFEVHFTCSCGEQYVIRCDSATPPAAPGAENSSGSVSPS